MSLLGSLYNSRITVDGATEEPWTPLELSPRLFVEPWDKNSVYASDTGALSSAGLGEPVGMLADKAGLYPFVDDGGVGPESVLGGISPQQNTAAILKADPYALPVGDSPYAIYALVRWDGTSTDIGIIIIGGLDSTGQALMMRVHTDFRLNCGWWGDNIYSPTAAIDAGKWTVVGTDYDGATRRLFVGDSVVASDSASGRSGSASQPVVIGTQAHLVTNEDIFKGVIGSALAFDGPLSPANHTKVVEYLKGLAEPISTIGYGGDLHYASSMVTYEDRYRQDAPQKLNDAISYWNSESLDALQMNGDYIDHSVRTGDSTPTKSEAISDLQGIETVFGNANISRHFTFGNHDLHLLSKTEFMAEVAGFNSAYYSYEAGGVQVVVLDACYYADDDAAGYDSGNYTYEDTYIPPTQMSWLQSELDASAKPVVVFCHQLLAPDAQNPQLVVDNAPDVRAVLESSNNVIAVFSGHEHENDKSVVNDISYFNMEAMTDGADPANAYAKITISSHLDVQVAGIGQQSSY